MAPDMNNPKYDVAISFLSRDNPIALDFESRLSPSLNVFVYPKKQDEVAATDGLDTFRDVFLNQSRSALVLFGDGWGSTPWTRVEEAAIKDRCLRDGWEYLIFLILDSKSTLPKWLPQTRIRLNFEEYGIEQSVGVIKSRVQELGGTIHKETIEEFSARLKRKKDFQERRERFLSSPDAAEVAKKTALELFVQFESLTPSASEPQTQFPIRSKREFQSLKLESMGFTLVITWHYEASNSLYNSRLFIRIYEDDRNIRFDFERKWNKIEEQTYDFDITENEQIGWRERSHEKRFIDSKQLAEQHFRHFLEKIQEYILREK